MPKEKIQDVLSSFRAQFGATSGELENALFGEEYTPARILDSIPSTPGQPPTDSHKHVRRIFLATKNRTALHTELTNASEKTLELTLQTLSNLHPSSPTNLNTNPGLILVKEYIAALGSLTWPASVNMTHILDLEKTLEGIWKDASDGLEEYRQSTVKRLPTEFHAFAKGEWTKPGKTLSPMATYGLKSALAEILAMPLSRELSTACRGKTFSLRECVNLLWGDLEILEKPQKVGEKRKR